MKENEETDQVERQAAKCIDSLGLIGLEAEIHGLGLWRSGV